MQDNPFTEKEIEIFTFFHKNQGKHFEINSLAEELKTSKILINECLFRWQRLVETENMKFKKNKIQVCERYKQINLI
jgi:hypothetical protein